MDGLQPRMSQKICAGGLAVALHLGLLLALATAGGQQDGRDSDETPTIQLVLLEAADARPHRGVELKPIEPVPEPTTQGQLLDAIESTLRRVFGEPDIKPEPAELAVASIPAPIIPTPTETIAIETSEPTEPATIAVSATEKVALSRRLERLAEESVNAPQAQVTWEEDGKQYSAMLVREAASDGTGLERVVAQVSAADRGRQWTTRVHLKRLAFSQFTQLVDHWDPTVQLHQDEIIGRFHSNTRFNLLYDRHAKPKLIGRVTTAAAGFNADWNGARRDAGIFKAGVETRASRIFLPEELQPSEWTPDDEKARIHEIQTDTRITFFADGSYTTRSGSAPEVRHVNDSWEHPIYFIATRGAQLFVKGTVAGKVLVYSPDRIVIEDDLKYAHDPRGTPASPDYLGLVSDRYVVIAQPSVTGPGDLEIDAAIFAGRRFVVTYLDHPRSATLRIYGSLSAGSVSASEPRYAVRIEYDERFERLRPPGFPSTNRHEIDEWDAYWTETSRTAAD